LRAGLVAAATVAACAIALAGCGGGDSGESSVATTTAADLPTITAPTTPTTDQSQPDNAPAATGASSPDSAQANRAPFERAMAPFYDCLSRHGVHPSLLSGTSLHGNQLRDPELVHKEIEAKIACIPELPPRLRKAAERLKRRTGQRNG
jgi:hypothetical protein